MGCTGELPGNFLKCKLIGLFVKSNMKRGDKKNRYKKKKKKKHTLRNLQRPIKF